MRQFNWLHISDFHIKDGDGYDSMVVLSALVSKVQEYKESGRQSPEAIFVTGDIAHSGKSTQYQQASAFFDELLAATGLNKSRLFVIPGNHDVDRDQGEMLLRTLADDQKSISFFGKPSQVDQYINKLQAFRTWHSKYFAGIRSLAPHTSCEPLSIIEVNGLRIAVSLINSALFSQGDDDHAKLWIGTRCLDPIVAAVRDSMADIRIVLVHHPLDWLHDAERSVITSTLNDNFDLILRGHLHETDVQSTAGVMGSALHIVCGAAYQGSRWPNRVLFAKANFEQRQVIIHPIRYETTPRRVWTLDPSVFPSALDYEGQYSVVWKGELPSSSSNDGGG